MGSEKADLSEFPDSARLRAGHELFMVQVGRDPDDWKPMASVGPGVREIRARERSGQYRLIYVASIGSAIYVLHAFRKKSRRSSILDIKLAQQRYREAKADESKE